MMPASPRLGAMTLGDLFGGEIPPPARLVSVTDITLDSRRVVPGGLFLAVPGARHHGLDFLRQALDAGAAAVAWAPSSGRSAPVIAPPAVCFPIEGLQSRLGEVADRFFGCPSRAAEIVGVTGTNGKTTCAHLISSALNAVGRKAGYMGTIGSGLPGHLTASLLTTPDVVETHRRLAELVADGAGAAVMEVSSHALDQDRVQGIRFAIAAFTNLSRDHLDYHGDMSAYAEAKRRLFSLPGLRWAVANTDDPEGVGMLKTAGGDAQTIAVGVQPCSQADRRLVIRECRPEPDGLLVRLNGDWGELTIPSRLIGEFNGHNLALALAVMIAMDIPVAQACKALARVPAPPGRMEIFRSPRGNGPAVVVDYAHSPDALQNVLSAVRTHFDGAVTLVFGCGGDRDRGKRSQMGRIAETGADTVIVTDDNPRSEDGDRIVADILAGMTRAPEVIRDREEATRMAFGRAGGGDVVLIAGKGHENYQLIGDHRLDYSDREIAAQLTGDTR